MLSRAGKRRPEKPDVRPLEERHYFCVVGQPVMHCTVIDVCCTLETLQEA